MHSRTPWLIRLFTREQLREFLLDELLLNELLLREFILRKLYLKSHVSQKAVGTRTQYYFLDARTFLHSMGTADTAQFTVHLFLVPVALPSKTLRASRFDFPSPFVATETQVPEQFIDIHADMLCTCRAVMTDFYLDSTGNGTRLREMAERQPSLLRHFGVRLSGLHELEDFPSLLKQYIMPCATVGGIKGRGCLALWRTPLLHKAEHFLDQVRPSDLQQPFLATLPSTI